jgi:hypothetical protein
MKRLALWGLAMAMIPAVAMAQAQPPLTPKQMAAIEATMAVHGKDVVLVPVLVQKLGLSQQSYRELPVRDNRTGLTHAFITIPGSGYILAMIDGEVAHSYRLDLKLSLIASVAINHSIPSEISDPVAGATTELAYWAHVADQLPAP